MKNAFPALAVFKRFVHNNKSKSSADFVISPNPTLCSEAGAGVGTNLELGKEATTSQTTHQLIIFSKLQTVLLPIAVS